MDATARAQRARPKRVGQHANVGGCMRRIRIMMRSSPERSTYFNSLLGLKKRPDDAAKARTQPVPDEGLLSILKYDDYDGWYLDNFGNTDMRYLVKTFEFPHFNQAAQFMEMVSNHCRILDHHPEWRNVFNHVTVALSTWDAKRQVTIYDLNLALFMNKVARVVTVKANGLT